MKLQLILVLLFVANANAEEAPEAPKRWLHVESGTLVFDIDDASNLKDIQERFGETELIDYVNGAQVAYVDKEANSCIVFASAGAGGCELIICRPERLPGKSKDFDFDDNAFVSSRRIILGDSVDYVLKTLGKPFERSEKRGVIKLWYNASAEDEGAPCGAHYDGRYIFADGKLVEMRFWDGS